MVKYLNSAEGGTHGVAVTTANSSGASGDAFTVEIAGGSAITFDNVNPTHGLLSHLFTPVSGGNCRTLWTFAATNQVVISVYYVAGAAWNVNERFIQILDNVGSEAGGMIIRSDRRLQLVNEIGASVYVAPTGVILNDGVKYRIELRVVRGTTATNGTIQYAFYLGDNTVPIDAFSSSTQNTGTLDLTSMRLGRANTSGLATTPFRLDSYQLFTGTDAIGVSNPWPSTDPADSYDYIYAREYVPPMGNFTPSHFSSITTDTTYTTVARVPAGQLMSAGHTGNIFTTYQFWDGNTWVPTLSSIARLKDSNGSDIAGDTGVAKLATGSYILVAQNYTESIKRVYSSTTPQGPWTLYSTVPAPPFGADKFAAGVYRIAQGTKVYTDFPAPVGHIMTMCQTSDWINLTGVIGQHVVSSGLPYFLAVPLPGTTGTSSIMPGVISLTTVFYDPTVVAPQTLAPDMIQIPGMSQESLVTINLFATPGAISAGTTMQQPTVTILAANTVTPLHINTAVTMYDPSVSNINVNISPPGISVTTALYQPTIGAYLNPDVISVATVMQTPIVALSTLFMSPGRIDAGVFTFIPTVTVGEIIPPSGLVADVQELAPTASFTELAIPKTVVLDTSEGVSLMDSNAAEVEDQD